MNWYNQFLHEPDAANTPGADQSAIRDDDARPRPWGLRARDLIVQLRRLDPARLPLKTTVELDRKKELVPHGMGTQLRISRGWANYKHPVDFLWPSNKWIDLKLQATVSK